MRKVKPALMFVWVVCIAGLAACATSASLLRARMAELADKEEIVIVVYGDEISGGEGDYLLSNTYASMLKPRLIELWGKRISMINSSEPNESFRLASRRMEEDILAFRPDIVFVMLGRVDAFTDNLPVFNHKRNVESFLGKLKHENKFVVVLTTPGLRGFVNAPDDVLYQFDEFVTATKDAARFYHYPVIDVASRMNRLREDDPEAYKALFSDDIHLSEAGKEYIADMIYDAMSRATVTP